MYEDKTPENIREGILDAIETEMQTREGSFMSDMVAPVSVELHKMYNALNAVQPIVWVDETSGIYLDMAAEDVGIAPRKSGTYSNVDIEIQGREGVNINAGAQFLTDDGIIFKTVESKTIGEENIVVVAAQSIQIGDEQNVPANTINRQYSPDSRIVSVNNPESAKGGTNGESDQSLYNRIADGRKKPSTSGNIYDYERWAKEVDGVAAVKVFPLWQGPGTVRVLVADEQRRPVDDKIVQSCYLHIESVRPIGANVTVSSVRESTINIHASVHLDGSVSLEQARDNFVKNIESYIFSIAFYQSKVLFHRVGAILIETEGISDYDGLLLNNEMTSVIVESDQVPILGEVTLVET